MSPADPPSEPPSTLSRRAALTALGTASATALAGCNALGEETTPVYDGDWTQFGNGATNTNRVDGRAPAPDGRKRLTSAGWAYTPPVVHGRTVYFAADRHVSAFGTGGTQRWSWSFYEVDDLPENFAVSGAPTVDPERGLLYVPTRVVGTVDGPDPPPASIMMVSLDGALQRVVRVGDERTYGVTLQDGDVYARSATACVRLGPDGTERWRRPLDALAYDEYNLGDDMATQTAPAVTDDAVYVPSNDALVKLDSATGEERWRVPVDTPYAASTVGSDGVVQTGWQETVAVDHDGAVRWRRDDVRSIAAAGVGDDDCYVVTPGGLHELDVMSGETNWEAHVSTDGTAAPVVTDESVLVATGNLVAYRRDVEGLLPKDRERWEAVGGDAMAYSTPVIADGRVFVVGVEGLVALGRGDSIGVGQ